MEQEEINSPYEQLKTLEEGHVQILKKYQYLSKQKQRKDENDILLTEEKRRDVRILRELSNTQNWKENSQRVQQWDVELKSERKGSSSICGDDKMMKQIFWDESRKTIKEISNQLDEERKIVIAQSTEIHTLETELRFAQKENQKLASLLEATSQSERGDLPLHETSYLAQIKAAIVWQSEEMNRKLNEEWKAEKEQWKTEEQEWIKQRNNWEMKEKRASLLEMEIQILKNQYQVHTNQESEEIEKLQNQLRNKKLDERHLEDEWKMKEMELKRAFQQELKNKEEEYRTKQEEWKSLEDQYQNRSEKWKAMENIWINKENDFTNKEREWLNIEQEWKKYEEEWVKQEEEWKLMISDLENKLKESIEREQNYLLNIQQERIEIQDQEKESMRGHFDELMKGQREINEERLDLENKRKIIEEEYSYINHCMISIQEASHKLKEDNEIVQQMKRNIESQKNDLEEERRALEEEKNTFQEATQRVGGEEEEQQMNKTSMEQELPKQLDDAQAKNIKKLEQEIVCLHKIISELTGNQRAVISTCDISTNRNTDRSRTARQVDIKGTLTLSETNRASDTSRKDQLQSYQQQQSSSYQQQQSSSYQQQSQSQQQQQQEQLGEEICQLKFQLSNREQELNILIDNLEKVSSKLLETELIIQQEREKNSKLTEDIIQLTSQTELLIKQSHTQNDTILHLTSQISNNNTAHSIHHQNSQFYNTAVQFNQISKSPLAHAFTTTSKVNNNGKDSTLSHFFNPNQSSALKQLNSTKTLNLNATTTIKPQGEDNISQETSFFDQEKSKFYQVQPFSQAPASLHTSHDLSLQIGAAAPSDDRFDNCLDTHDYEPPNASEIPQDLDSLFISRSDLSKSIEPELRSAFSSFHSRHSSPAPALMQNQVPQIVQVQLQQQPSRMGIPLQRRQLSLNSNNFQQQPQQQQIVFVPQLTQYTPIQRNTLQTTLRIPIPTSGKRQKIFQSPLI